MAIPFTQYLMPNGRAVGVAVDRPPAIEALAQNVLTAGYHFDAEFLSTGQVSFTCEKNDPATDDEDLPIAHEICTNGPAVLDAIDRLVCNAAERLRLA